MNLWSDEWEALRPKLREEADAFIASFGTAPQDPAMPLDEWVAEFRTGHLDMIFPSDKATDRTIDGPAGPMRLRTFIPDHADAVMLHIHGGGWVAGQPEMLDLLHEMLCAELNLAVVSLDYRLAPEHPYPAPQDDCEAAAVWLLEHAEQEFGSGRLLISGESAGAHLSACTLLRVRDKHQAADRFIGANLLFGQFDHSLTLPSQHHRRERRDVLTPQTMARVEECLHPGLSPEERRDPDISPLYAELHDMPPALFTVGTDDILVDDTLLMSSLWAMAGNQMELIVYPEGPHACIGVPTIGADWFPRLQGFLRGCIKG